MKKKNNFLGVLIILAGVLIVGVLGLYGLFLQKNTPVYFNATKKDQAQRLYNKVMDVNFATHYPKTPDEVMEYHLDLSRLIYSDMIVEDSLFGDIVTKIRQLYGPELLELNPYETQLETVLAGVNMLREEKISQTGYEQLPTIFNSLDANLCFIRAKQNYSNGEILYWEYQLERVLPENNWKIIRFERTNENYEPISDVWWGA